MIDESALSEQVTREAARLGLALQPSEASRLAVYLRLIERWGQRLNLTGRPDASELAARQLADAFVLARELQTIEPAAASALDVGAGAGLTGLPLLVLRPALSLGLVEATRRKCAFLRAALHELGLQATVHEARLEQLSLVPHDLVLSRATWAPQLWAEVGTPLLAPRGRLVCFLARDPAPAVAGLLEERCTDYQLSDGSPRRLLLLRRAV
jgi:16S rRNA (guanine527-N7)-methyltransferase